MRTRLPVILPLFLVVACAGTESKISGPGRMRYRLMADPSELDPVRSHDINSETVVFQLFDGLVEFDPETLRIEPAVAESWDVSPDGLSYTFHLRPGVKFHNGREVRADDVVWSFERAQRPGTINARPWALQPILGARAFQEGRAERIEGLEAPDARTVRIRLERPFGPFLSHLVVEQASILPREVYEDPDEAYREHPVGCGPFRMGEWHRGQSLILNAFDDYYGEGPYLRELQFRVISDQETATQEYRAGGLEITDEIPSGRRKALQEEFGEQYRQWPQIAVRGILFNHARPPFGGNRALRQALNHAVDRDYLLRVVDEGKDRKIAGMIPPGLPSHDPDLAGYDYDPERARQLLKEAGYPGGEGLGELTILFNDNEGHRRMLERVSADMREVGVTAVPRSIDLTTFLSAVAGTETEPPTAEMIYFAWVADFPDAYNFLYVNLHSDNLGPGSNYGRYASAEFDRLLDAAVAAPAPEARYQLYRKAERVAVEDAAWLFIYSFQDEALVRPEVQDLVLSPLGDFASPFHRVRLARRP